MDLREQIARLLNNAPGTLNNEDLADQILGLNLVQLDENASFPNKNPYGNCTTSEKGWDYAEAVNTMLNDGFRKVKLPRG